MPTPEARRQRTRIWVGVTLIVASFVVIAIGAQASLYQRNVASDDARNRDQDRCVQAWGTEIVEALDVRVKANGRVDRATAERDEAIDEIILVIIRLRQDPPKATDEDVSRVLDRYYRVLTRLREVRATAEETREDNPYPELDC